MRRDGSGIWLKLVPFACSTDSATRHPGYSLLQPVRNTMIGCIGEFFIGDKLSLSGRILMIESARLSHCVGNPSLVVQSIKLYKQIHQGIGESEHLGH
jgi:hypothetical protein